MSPPLRSTVAAATVLSLLPTDRGCTDIDNNDNDIFSSGLAYITLPLRSVICASSSSTAVNTDGDGATTDNSLVLFTDDEEEDVAVSQRSNSDLMHGRGRGNIDCPFIGCPHKCPKIARFSCARLSSQEVFRKPPSKWIPIR